MGQRTGISVKAVYLGACISVLILALAALCLSPWLTYTVNLTQSLPGRLYVIHKGASVTRGDLVAYAWPGGATYPAGTLFIKRVMGLPGDRVERIGSQIGVNNHVIGQAKPRSRAGVPLTPVESHTVLPHRVFVATPHPDSLDSRYALSGDIAAQSILGRAYEIF